MGLPFFLIPFRPSLNIPLIPMRIQAARATMEITRLIVEIIYYTSMPLILAKEVMIIIGKP